MGLDVNVEPLWPIDPAQVEEWGIHVFRSDRQQMRRAPKREERRAWMSARLS
jgi:hypothetical protein